MRLGIFIQPLVAVAVWVDGLAFTVENISYPVAIYRLAVVVNPCAVALRPIVFDLTDVLSKYRVVVIINFLFLTKGYGH